MEKIPTLTKRDRIGFWLLHMLLLVPPFYFLLFILIRKPEYFLSLLQSGPAQPLGWFFLLLVFLDFGAMVYLAINSIRNIEKRPVKKSILVMVLIMFLNIFTFIIIFTLPALLLVLNLLFSLYIN
ncbi:MAG: hypothetical protein JW748_00920 [Anaerolineales bacterium]|nr:hypothetical protein [Anaerolineales bacterium]